MQHLAIPPIRRRATAVLLLGFALVLGAALAAAPALARTPFVNELVDVNGTNGWQNCVALDAQGNPHVSYQSIGGSDLKYARKSGAAWIVEWVDWLGSVGSYNSLALDAQGNPCIAYMDATNTTLKFARRSAGTWTIENADAAWDGGLAIALALDAQGQPRIAYHDLTANDLRYAFKSAGIWTTQVVDSAGTVGYDAEIAIDANGHTRFSYVDPTNDVIKLATMWQSYTQVLWTIETVDAIGAAGAYSALALDAQGNPCIAYHHGTSGLKYAAKTGTAWTIETVASLGSIYPYCDLAIDARGYPRIVFHDESASVLRYASRSSSSWTVETLYSTGLTGRQCAVTLDAQGNPHITYDDSNDYRLKYAHAAVSIVSPSAAVTWPVGSLQTVEWSGVGPADLYLSVDGGSSATLLRSGLLEHRVALRVPHTPTRFAQIRILRSSPLASDNSDSFFTIDAAIALMKFDATAASGGERAVNLAWATAPGPEADIRYRIERATGGEGASFAPAHAGLLAEPAFTDVAPGTRDVSRYRLVAVNGLGEEYVLGERSVTPVLGEERDLLASPNPARGPVEIAYRAPAARRYELAVYDASGRLVRSLASGAATEGVASTTWDRRDASGREVAAGTYLLTLTSPNGYRASERVAIIR